LDSPNEKVSEILIDYLNILKLNNDKDSDKIYATRCIIRYEDLDSLDNVSQFKMVGKSIHHSAFIDEQTMINKLSYDFVKLLTIYPKFNTFDIIIISKI
jgi:hypothetical protein